LAWVRTVRLAGVRVSPREKSRVKLASGTLEHTDSTSAIANAGTVGLSIGMTIVQ
jgi:hypothetical protein